MTAGIDRQAQVLLIKAAEDEAVTLLPGIPEGPFWISRPTGSREIVEGPLVSAVHRVQVHP